MRRIYSALAIVMWILTCAFVFLSIDWYATRPVEVHIEDFRTPGLSDEAVLIAAVQEARKRQHNWWWIHDNPSVLVLDSLRDYNLDPNLLKIIDFPIAQQFEESYVIPLQPLPAAKLP